MHFFTTIAHQLATQIDWHRRALGPRVDRDPVLLNKIHVQFHQFIIGPFLEIAWRNRGGSAGEMTLRLFRTYRLFNSMETRFPSCGFTLVILQLPSLMEERVVCVARSR